MRYALPFLLAVLFALAVTQAARSKPAPEPWATVNVCDTETRANEIGIRGSMQGIGRKVRMLMRFRVQYQDSEGRWQLAKTGADSGWRNVGAGRRGEHDAGWTFEFKPPASGGAHVLRGAVSYEWRRGGGRVVRRERRFTEGGHPGTAGAEPADFSAATCSIA